MTRTFKASVYKSSRAFCIPKAERTALGINSGDSVHLTITSQSGTELFRGRKELRSGPEIYGKDIAHALTPGATIIVEASEPITAYRSPSEKAAAVLTEGNRIAILVNRFERSGKARAACIEAFGTACQVCGFDFGKSYGPLGQGFIHVHHLTPVSLLGEEYVVDPKTDLRPVCPNCHEMLHTGKTPLSIEELKQIVENRRASSKHA